MLINGTEVQLSQEEVDEVSRLYGHIHFHGNQPAQEVANLWIAGSRTPEEKERRQEAVRALSLLA